MKNSTSTPRSLSGFLLAAGLLTAAVHLGGAAPASGGETLGFSLTEQSSSATELTVTVVLEGKLSPVEGAKVSVSDPARDPGELPRTAAEQVTDATGKIVFSNLPAGRKAITVSKSGFASITVAGVEAHNITFFLKALPTKPSQPVLSGASSGWEPITNSSLVYAGIVFRSLSVYELPTFQPMGLISPLKDTINVFGERQVPSNLVVPKQTVKISFFTINLDKPAYRLPMKSGAQSQLVLLQGNVPGTDVMDAAQSGSEEAYLEIINRLTMTRVGVTDSFTPQKDSVQNVTTSIPVGTKLEVTPQKPPFAAMVLSAAVTDTAGDRTVLVPTDVKMSAKIGEAVKAVNLAAPKSGFGKSQNVVTFAMDTGTGRLSGIISGASKAKIQPGAFLDVPQLADLKTLPASLKIAVPSQGLGGLVFNATNSKLSADSFPIWYVYALPGASDMAVSTEPVAGVSASLTDYASVQFEFAQGKIDMGTLTRFSRSTAWVQKKGLSGSSSRSMEEGFPFSFFKGLVSIFQLN